MNALVLPPALGPAHADADEQQHEQRHRRHRRDDAQTDPLGEPGLFKLTLVSREVFFTSATGTLLVHFS